jgi:hypothetical protein
MGYNRTTHIHPNQHHSRGKQTMTKKVPFPTTEILRKEESLRLHTALGHALPGSEDYTRILAQITALNAHSRAVELKELEQAHQRELEHYKQDQANILERQKADTAIAVERQKAEAAHTQKQWDLAGKLITVGAILIFEHSGHAIISKAFGLIRD